MIPDCNPLVSVIIAVYNGSQTIDETLSSVLNQSHRYLEVIVVDDGSTDDTVDIVRLAAIRDTRVRLIHQQNAGVGAARNRGISESSGEFVAIVDADDLWAPDKIREQLRLMIESGSRVGLVYCWSSIVDENGGHLRMDEPHLHEGMVRVNLIQRNFTGNASTPLFRKDALNEVGGYMTRGEQGGAQGCEDWDLALRVAERYEIRVARSYLVYYRQSSSSMTLNLTGMRRSYFLFLRRARSRNRDLPRFVFRWSRGLFHLFLLNRCFQWGLYSMSVRYAFNTVLSDPAFIISRNFCRLLCTSAFRFIGLHKLSCSLARGKPRNPLVGRRRSIRPRQNRVTLYRRIQDRRALVLAKL
jgi:glycosyltransferase involved in cell wall biosynthesis